MMDAREAADALSAIQDSRAQVLAACDVPPLRHLAFAAVMGGLVSSPALPLPWRMAVFVVLMAAIAWIVRWDRRRTGMFVNGYRAGKTRKVTFAMLAGCLALYLLSIWAADGRGLWWPPLPLGLAAAGLAYGGSLWWQRVFVREMRAA